ncbi:MULTISPECIES: SulP family inorganic anion transporter [Bradyrhizobium]|uniref:SulP family inorganic anion transporter n=1 Tax=Bradyrhizobium zhanjiangense TaxID=1325107 RepID=A0A4V1L2E2_9BRAD|nr:MULTISPECIES: SulP family inorganic anion transporter [Bradyrhizobium]RXG94035.1 SulP family inorganic anion transporter [Bradyrhizobium zhanjiangense]RXH30949.1 SulP family sulfate transporter [Bradyrhizobium zhanjiangense]UQR64797.1 SulP family inorganic anion transporter [Bradyrhizobium sp. C-145]
MSITSDQAGQLHQLRRPTFVELYLPKLVTIWREGYGVADFRADVFAGLTVAIVALPLSMAIAIASGVTPDRGLYTAVVGGFIVSLLGGSRFQIGGPAGAFIVLVAVTAERHGVDGVILATMMAGLFLVAAGLLRVGTYIKFIPYPVTVGFTAGIAVIIFASQLRDLGGITLAGKEPSEFVPKLVALAGGLNTINPSAVVVAIGSIVIIAALRRWRPSWPGILIAVALAAVASAVLSLPVETIGSRFGGIPRELPSPALPAFSLEKAKAVLPDAIAFALLAAIESLLSAVVADGMTGRRHRSNCELVAQGVANIGSALFGGICVTGLIARTATNIRAGARGPLAGMLHSVFLLLFMLIAAPLASYIPLAALASVLVVVAWTMAEKQEFATLLRSSWGDAVVLLATFLLTIFRDLTEGILVGFALGAVLFIHRMAEMTGIEERTPLVVPDRPDDSNGARVPYDSALAVDRDVLVYRITGAFFFGAASAIGGVLDGVADQRKAFVVDFAAVPFLDSTAANVLGRVAAKAHRQGIRLFITGASPAVRRALLTHGVTPPRARYRQSLERAIADIKGRATQPEADEVAAS